MKILQINNCHYRRGGADVVYLNTGELLHRNGNDVIYFSMKNIKNIRDVDESLFVNNIDFINLSFLNKVFNTIRFIYSFEAKNKIKQVVKKYRPDIAHIHLYKAGLTSSILSALRNSQIPIVITLHDYGFLDPHAILLDGMGNIDNKTVNKSAFYSVINKHNRNSYLLSFIEYVEYAFHNYFFPFDKYFDCIIAVSKFSQKLHNSSKRFKWDVKHLYNFTPLVNNCNHVGNNDEIEEKYFLFFGRLAKQKGIFTLIKAFAKLNSNFKLKILGTGPLEKKIKKHILSKSIENIELTGHKSGDELFEIIKKSYFTIVPSQWYENNPMTIIESYALGVPVIGSDVGGIPELINENNTGFLFEMGSSKKLKLKMSKAINLSKKSYYLMKEKCLKYAEQNFSKKIHLKKLMKLYNNTIENYKK